VETALRKPAVHAGNGYQVATVRTASGQALHGFIRNESAADLQLQSFNGGLHLLPKSGLARIDRETKPYMPAWTGSSESLRDLIKFLQAAPERKSKTAAVAPAEAGGIDWPNIVKPKPGDWPSYHGQLSGNRYSGLGQITPGNL